MEKHNISKILIIILPDNAGLNSEGPGIFIGVAIEKTVMKQMVVRKEEIVPINYESANTPATVRQFKPVVFKEGNSICCILGPDRQQGIFACGSTLTEALRNWDTVFHKRLNEHKEDDEVTRFVLDNLSVSKKDVW
jgi:hypothetical protein